MQRPAGLALALWALSTPSAGAHTGEPQQEKHRAPRLGPPWPAPQLCPLQGVDSQWATDSGKGRPGGTGPGRQWVLPLFYETHLNPPQMGPLLENPQEEHPELCYSVNTWGYI